MSVDANFGLVRKRSAGHSTAEPKLGGLFFVEQSLVDERLHQLPSSSKPNHVIFFLLQLSLCADILYR